MPAQQSFQTYAQQQFQSSFSPSMPPQQGSITPVQPHPRAMVVDAPSMSNRNRHPNYGASYRVTNKVSACVQERKTRAMVQNKFSLEINF